MKKSKQFLLSALLLLSLSACQRVKRCEGMPACLKKAVRNEIICNDASLSTYLFQGQKVYVYNPGSCVNDGFSSVYDEQCNLICQLYGFIGRDSCMSVSFSSEAEFLHSCAL